MNGVVLEQVGQRLGVSQVVDGDKVEVFHASLFGRPHYLPTDPAEPVDSNLDRHAGRPLSGRRIAWKARAAEGDVTDDPGSAGKKRGRAGIQGRRGSDDVIHEHQVRAAQSRRIAVDPEGAGNIAESLLGSQPRLRGREVGANEYAVPHVESDPGTHCLSQCGTLVE